MDKVNQNKQTITLNNALDNDSPGPLLIDGGICYRLMALWALCEAMFGVRLKQERSLSYHLDCIP